MVCPPVIFDRHYPQVLALTADRAYYIRVLRSIDGFHDGTTLRDFIAHGTSDVWADLATQARHSEQPASYPVPALQSTTAGEWCCLYGELLTFDDPETRLPAIDRLEGFRPGGPSLYKRVLVPVCIEHGMALPVWLYIGPSYLINGRFLSSDRWPS